MKRILLEIQIWLLSALDRLDQAFEHARTERYRRWLASPAGLPERRRQAETEAGAIFDMVRERAKAMPDGMGLFWASREYDGPEQLAAFEAMWPLDRERLFASRFEALVAERAQSEPR